MFQEVQISKDAWRLQTKEDKILSVQVQRQIYFQRMRASPDKSTIGTRFQDKFKERFHDKFQISFIPRRLTRLKGTRFLTRLLSAKNQDKFLQISTRFHFSSYQDYCSNTPVKLLLKLLFIYFSSSCHTTS